VFGDGDDHVLMDDAARPSVGAIGSIVRHGRGGRHITLQEAQWRTDR